MARGQAENLFPLIEGFMSSSGWDWPDIDAIGVGVGPGNFTGIRISVSAARGLGLSLGIPVFGLTQFELAYTARSGPASVPSDTLVSIPAPRDMAYIQGFGMAAFARTALLIDPAAPPADLQLSSNTTVFGHRAAEIASHFNAGSKDVAYRPDAARMADLAKARYLDASTFPPRPAPNYVKAPDAAPPRDMPPRIIA